MYFIQSSNHHFTYTGSLGGKASHLFELIRLGCNVPEFVVISSDFFDSHTPSSNDYRFIREFIADFELEDDDLDGVRNYFEPGSLFAVRSSALGEDGDELSYAGLFETRLFVPFEELEQSILDVWLSLYSPRVEAYRKSHGITQRLSMAVIIQRMVNAEVSGVAFGINPVNGDRSEKCINAAFGAGEGLVSGAINADQYFIKNNKVESRLVKKTKRWVLDPETKRGMKVLSVDESEQMKASLSEKQALDLSSTLDRLQQHFCDYSDVEFAIENGQIYILQYRPVTTVSRLPDKNDTHIIWDNSNIIESYPGLTSPLTFSFITKMYESVYRQFSLLMGVSSRTVADSSHVYANMLGLIKGRVYYNLNSWYTALSKLPGYNINAAFMEKMMGVKEKFEIPVEVKKVGAGAWIDVLRAVMSILRNHNSINRQRRDFMSHINQVIAEYKSINWSSKKTSELIVLYQQFEETMLKKWKAPLVNDFFAMIYFGLLQKIVAKHKPGNNHLHNDLISSSKDIISTEPVRLSIDLCRYIRSDEDMIYSFTYQDEKIVWRELQTGQQPELLRRINEYLDAWGERCVAELKLETVSYSQDPVLFIRVLKGYVSNDPQKLEKVLSYNDELRIKAENEMRQALKGKPFKAFLFKYVLKKARLLVSQRENLRYQRTRGFGVVRNIFTEIGKRFYAERLIREPRDIFYLRMEEIFDYVEGKAVQTNLQDLIALRKKEYKENESKQPEERIHTYGMIYAGNDFYTRQAESLTDGNLKGVPCSAGKVKARVRILNSPHEVYSLEGDILVTSSTDPGWVTLFPSASGILVERGSLLSHSAIVSREMGIPCIVGIHNLLEALRTGDWVEMDGSTGVIKILEHGGVAQ